MQHRHHLAENAALAECQSLIQEAASGWQAASKAADQSRQAASQQAAQDFMHAAARHLYYQRALLQLLLRQLTFCVTELKGIDGLDMQQCTTPTLSIHSGGAAACQPLRGFRGCFPTPPPRHPFHLGPALPSRCYTKDLVHSDSGPIAPSPSIMSRTCPTLQEISLVFTL